MVAQLVRLLRGVVQVSTSEDAPRPVAFGIALGMMIGLVPKGNLIAAVLGVILLASQANLIAGGFAALVFSWVGMWTDPIAHRIGLAVLALPSLQPCWVRLYELPLAPWTKFNNTVVLGSLILGLALFYPVYRSSRGLLDRSGERIAETLAKCRAEKALAKAETAARRRLL